MCLGVGAVVTVVIVAVAVVVVPPGDDNQEDGGNTQLRFDGAASLVLLLTNLTELMSLSQTRWFALTLEDHFEELVIAGDCPFQPGWDVSLAQQQVLLPNGLPML